MALTASSSFSCRRPVMNTYAPSSTNNFAVARAIPDVAAVITATLPSNLPILIALFGQEVLLPTLVSCLSVLLRNRLLIRLQLTQNVLCRWTVAVTLADLLKQDVAVLVENEGRRICSFVRC